MNGGEMSRGRMAIVEGWVRLALGGCRGWVQGVEQMSVRDEVVGLCFYENLRGRWSAPENVARMDLRN